MASKPTFGDYIRARSYSYEKRKPNVTHSGATFHRSQDNHTPQSCNDDGRNGTCSKCLAVYTRLYG
jgi:hypothetical protein